IDAHDGILPDRTWLCVGSGTDRHFHAIVSDVVSAIGFVGWPAMARLVRAEFLSLRTREFVIADEALGASDARLIFHTILPNVLPLITSTRPCSWQRRFCLSLVRAFWALAIRTTSVGAT